MVIMKNLKKIFCILALLFFSPLQSFAAGMHLDESGRWVNEKGGNIYGDSRWNSDADPRWNSKADPKWSPDGDPRYKK